MHGTGIGTFSDRMRDAVRGGGAFSGLQEQGFITGLFFAPNSTWQGHHDQQRGKLLAYTDQIRIGLAGTLRDYEIDTHYGARLRGQDVHYNGQPTGYAIDPHEVINYIEAHDNETLWDAIQLKAANYTSLEQRVRMQMLGNSLVCLAQGIPFFHAGQELLRSKSLDRNSYNSGDWFNKLDWTYETNNWGVGLPPGENLHHWPLMGPLLANASIKPGKAQITRSLEHFKEMLQIRKSSKLFRLETVEDIKAKLRFWNTGPSQIPGLIVMHLADAGQRQVDDHYAQIVVLFNALPTDESIHAPVFAGAQLRLHPVQAAGSYANNATFNPDTSVFFVPAFTAAVFVEPKAAPIIGGQ
jgi:pullulanase-type alpha-1,6-glucosidase